MKLIDAELIINDLLHVKDDTNSSGDEVIFSIDDLIKLLNDSIIAYGIDKVVFDLFKLPQYHLDLADAMMDVSRNGVDRHFVCLEDVLELLNYNNKE